MEVGAAETGFWGDAFFQSDRDMDILDFFTEEMKTDSLYVPKDGPYKLRDQLNANNKLINKIAEIASGARDADPHIDFWGPKLVVVILGVVAIDYGAKLPHPLRQTMRDALKSRLGLYDSAKEEMREALAEYVDGEARELRGMGLYDTINMYKLLPFKRHPEQEGVNFPNPVWSAKYETAEDEDICAKCSKKAGVKLKKCARCLRIKYCGSECQREHWAEHKLVCKKDGLPPKLSPVKLQTYGVRPGDRITDNPESYLISEYSRQSPAPRNEE
ncbi:Zinc finger MYND domain-containing protein 10-like protein [Lasiodiplodia hormozganensis]|uniref:Zinc finger MYND domain-containing protein 10-like protein n=1 Tax=Lasiodiplodia hormozganensis TaxID=869390 RepID=A0AA39XUL9_9PEZI|nr:Zinc finger MYND domain-containing protein 10-like protein [Lasiodiplodia hormozganensis]